MSNYIYKQVHIDNLHPDTDNFRFDPVKNENEAIITMVNELPTKLYNLVKSILDNGGIDPSLLPNIVQYEAGSNEYVVMEGNRRITSLKIIKNVEKIKDTPHYSKFKKLLDKYDLSKIPDEYFCILYNNKEDTYFWTYLRHAGELSGEGLVPWNTLSIDRFKMGTKQAVPNISYYILNYLKANTDYQIDNTRFSTTLKRIVDSSVGKEYYGISVEDNKLFFSKNVNESVEKLCILIDNLKNKSITSRNSNTINDIENWIKRLEEEYCSLHADVESKEKKGRGDYQDFKDNTTNVTPKTNTEDKLNVTAVSNANNKQPDDLLKSKDKNEVRQNNSENENRPIQTPSVKTKKLFEDLAFMHLDSNKYNGIIKIGTELVKLSKNFSYNYVTYPIATAMLLRAYIEQAFKYFLNSKGHWSILCNSKKNPNGDPALSEILVYCRNNRKVLFTDKTQLRLFGMLFDSDSTVKDYLDLNIHHPNIVTITNIELKSFSNRGISGFLNYLIK